ncbi:hypothetical protein KIPB_008646, partial [Kipferlia bialata]
VVKEDKNGRPFVRVINTQDDRTCEAVLVYLQHPSVPLAFTILDGTQYEAGYEITLARSSEEDLRKADLPLESAKNVVAKPQQKRKKKSRKEREEGRKEREEERARKEALKEGKGVEEEGEEGGKRRASELEGGKKKRRPQQDDESGQYKLLSWKGNDEGARGFEQKTVVIEGMFVDADMAELNWKEELKESLTEEAGEIGDIQKIRIYDNAPGGVVSIRFFKPRPAADCARVMNGRWFDRRQLKAYLWDGSTPIVRKETREEEKARIAKFQRDLENEDSD